MRRVAAAATVATVALLVAGALGCGGGGDDASAGFRRDLFATRARYDPLGEMFVKTLQTAHQLDSAQLATRFSGYAEQFDEMRAEFAALSPPEDVAPELMAFVDGLRAVSADLREIARLASGGPSDAVDAAQEKLIADLTADNLAGRRLRAAALDSGE